MLRKDSKMKRILLFLAVVCCFPSVCNADLLFVFSEASDGGVIVSASGIGTTLSAVSPTNTFSFTLNGDIVSGSNDAEADSFSGAENRFIRNPGARNENIENVNAFSLVNTGPTDSLEFRTAGNQNFSNGASYSLEFTAVFLESELEFDQLNIGNFSVDAGAFGNATVSFSAVPEPTTLASMGMIGLFGAGVAWRKRRKAKKELTASVSTEE